MLGMTTPQAAAKGMRTRDVLSPTPPVEYLSIFGLVYLGKIHDLPPESIISSARVAVSCVISTCALRSKQCDQRSKTATLAEEMMLSGEVVDLSKITKPKIDKYSTVAWAIKHPSFLIPWPPPAESSCPT